MQPGELRAEPRRHGAVLKGGDDGALHRKIGITDRIR
jgi:hypothetical protein